MNIIKRLGQKSILKNKANTAIWIISSAVILVVAYIIFLLYSAHRALWLDEAMLAFSFCKRSLYDLTAEVFEWDQSAPVLYLYIVKVITLIFGTSEATLRIYSLFAYVASLTIAYRLLQKAFSIKYPIICVAFISSMSALLYYSNEFKPYMNDCFSVLLVLFLYYLFSQNRIGFIPLSIMYSTMLWLSYPALFFVGGVLAYELYISIINKNKPIVYKILFGGAIVLISFLLHYFSWLKPVAEDDFMVNYWMNYKFPLFPASLQDIRKIFSLSRQLISRMGYAIILIASLAVSGTIVSVGKKNKYSIVILISIFLSLLASYIGKYPFHQRLMLFVYPLIGFFVFIALDSLVCENSEWQIKVIAASLTVAVFLANYSAVAYLKPEGRYREKQEVNYLIEYLDENIKAGETLYVYYHTVPVFSFKNGYDNLHIGQRVDPLVDNIIYGERFFNDDQNHGDIETIMKTDECYVLMSHHSEARVAPLMEALKKNGYLELVMEHYATPLYFHTNTLDKVKTDVKFELLNYHGLGDKGITEIKITNTGGTYFNADGIEEIYLMSRDDLNFRYRLEQKNIRPGEEIIIKHEFTWTQNKDTINVQLVNKGKYWYDEIGVPPISVFSN